MRPLYNTCAASLVDTDDREWLKRWAKNLFTKEIAETKETIKVNLRGLGGKFFWKAHKISHSQMTKQPSNFESCHFEEPVKVSF
jgi:hypothetical protein